jgi:hypothetical protein
VCGEFSARSVRSSFPHLETFDANRLGSRSATEHVPGLIPSHKPVMNEILRLSGAVERDPAIDAWLNSPPHDLRAIAREWFAEMRECGDDVRELMHDGCPVACVHDAPFGYVNTFKSHVNVGFFNGALLRDPARLLEGTGKRMRHVKLRPGREIDSASLTALIHASYQDMQVRAELE